MKRIILLTATAIVLAGPAFAAETCRKAPTAQFKPTADLKAQLEKEGMKVSKIKTENGCYEVYAIDAAGKKVNMAFNAETLAKVDNAEAGEN